MFAAEGQPIHALFMAVYALVTWETENGSLRLGEIVEVDDEEQTRRVRVRSMTSGHMARVFAEHLAWMPPGISPSDPRVVRLVAELPKKLAACAFSLDAHELGTALVAEALGTS